MALADSSFLKKSGLFTHLCRSSNSYNHHDSTQTQETNPGVGRDDCLNSLYLRCAYQSIDAPNSVQILANKMET